MIYIKVNEICHTSGHYDACQGFVSSVRRTAGAHQRPVLLPHQVEYWIGKDLKNTIAPLISTWHNLWTLTSQCSGDLVRFRGDRPKGQLTWQAGVNRNLLFSLRRYMEVCSVKTWQFARCRLVTRTARTTSTQNEVRIHSGIKDHRTNYLGVANDAFL